MLWQIYEHHINLDDRVRVETHSMCLGFIWEMAGTTGFAQLVLLQIMDKEPCPQHNTRHVSMQWCPGISTLEKRKYQIISDF
jgi:hypothetical protein